MCSDVLCVIMQATHDDAYNMHLKMQHAQKHRNIFIIRTVYKSVANKRENFPQNKSSMVLTFGSNEKNKHKY